jgi:hypothetical protein
MPQLTVRGPAIRRLVATSTLLGVTLAGAASPALAGDPPEWGYAVVRNASSEAGYQLAAKDRGNAAGGSVTAQRIGPGRTLVIFEDLLFAGGTAQVTPLTTKPRLCSLIGWEPEDGDLQVTVQCATKSGAPADTRFSLNVLALYMYGGEAAYLWADQPASAGYVPDPTYQHNTVSNTDAAVARMSEGTWAVGMLDLVNPGGNVQISNYGFGAEACKAVSWTPSGSEGLDTRVTCRTPDGDLDDTRWTMLYTREMSMLGPGNGKAAYLWANKPKAGSYTPKASHRWSSEGGTPTVVRTAKGRYRVTLPGMPLGGSVQVTATGTSGSRCHVSAIRTTGLPQRIGVRCFTATGAPADSRFSLSFAR